MGNTKTALKTTADQRREQFEGALDAVRADIFLAATIFKQMSELGDDVSFVRPGMQRILLRIADKQTLPEVFTHFTGKTQLEVAKLPLEKQRALIESGVEEVAPKATPAQKYTPRAEPVRREHIGGVYSQPFNATPEASIFLDHKRCGILVNGAFVSAVKMRQALLALEGKTISLTARPEVKKIVEVPIKFSNCKECGLPLPHEASRNICDKCFDRMF